MMDTPVLEIVHKFTLLNNFKVPLQVKQIRVESKKFQILNAENFRGLKVASWSAFPKTEVKVSHKSQRWHTDHKYDVFGNKHFDHRDSL